MFARLNRETTDPSFGDVGWNTHWFAAWLVSPRASNGLPVLVLVSIRRREPSSWWQPAVYCGSMDQPHAELWMRVADAPNRLREAKAAADAQRSRAAALRTQARELSAQLAQLAKARASGEASPNQT